MSSFVWFSWGWVFRSAFPFSLSVLPGATAFLSITAAGSLALFGFGPRGQATMQLAASAAIQDFAFARCAFARPRAAAVAVEMDGCRFVISALIARCWRRYGMSLSGVVHRCLGFAIERTCVSSNLREPAHGAATISKARSSASQAPPANWCVEGPVAGTLRPATMGLALPVLW